MTDPLPSADIRWSLVALTALAPVAWGTTYTVGTAVAYALWFRGIQQRLPERDALRAPIAPVDGYDVSDGPLEPVSTSA